MLDFRKFRTRNARIRSRKRFAIQLAALIFFCIALLVGLVYLFRQPTLLIHIETISGLHAVQESVVRSILSDELDTVWLGIIPRDTILTLNTSLLESSLTKVIPRIKEARISRIGLSGLAVQIIERTPAALWCGDIVPPVAYAKGVTSDEKVNSVQEEQWGKCYSMDDASYIYAEAPTFTVDTLIRYYGPLNKAEPIGQSFLTHADFAAQTLLASTLKKDNLFVRAVLIVDERDMELYLKSGLRVLVERSTEALQLAQSLRAVLDAESEDMLNTIEYIDMRFPNKAYVKYMQ